MFQKLIFLIFCLNIAIGGKATKKWVDTRKIMYGVVTQLFSGDSFNMVNEENQWNATIKIYCLVAPIGNEPLYQETTLALSNMILGKRVKVLFEYTDVMGKTVGEVYLNNTNIGQELVKAGGAKVAVESCKYDDYRKLFQIAKESKTGIWGHLHFIDPWAYIEQERMRKQALKDLERSNGTNGTKETNGTNGTNVENGAHNATAGSIKKDL